MNQHAATARQGHKYQLGDKQVLAMESGEGCVFVREIDHKEAYPLMKPEYVPVSWLVALPMKYFGGKVPA